MTAAAISAELRTGASSSLRRRRAVVALSLVASGAMTVISAFQTGLLKHLPEPPLPGLDADRVDSSPEAYPLGVPDALLGLGSYATTAALAAAGGNKRSPLLSLALAGKVALDTAVAAKLTVDQWTKAPRLLRLVPARKRRHLRQPAARRDRGSRRSAPATHLVSGHVAPPPR